MGRKGKGYTNEMIVWAAPWGDLEIKLLEFESLCREYSMKRLFNTSINSKVSMIFKNTTLRGWTDIEKHFQKTSWCNVIKPCSRLAQKSSYSDSVIRTFVIKIVNVFDRSPIGTNKSQYRNTIAGHGPDDDTVFTKIAVEIEVGKIRK